MTFEEAIKSIKSSTHWCGIACDGDEDCDRHGLMYYENAFDIVCKLQATYAPKIKMTIEQKDELMQFLDESDLGFVTFLFCVGSGDNLYKEFSEKELMQAWLHPELIEVSDDSSRID